MRSIFHHEEIYRGKALMAKLKNFHVTVCGAGALGSNFVDNIIRQGFARVRAIDMDRVEEHNINTQCYGTIHTGMLKVDALKSIVFNTTGIEIEALGKELTKSTIKKFLKGTQCVVDAFDNAASRKLVTDYCTTNNIPCLHVGLHDAYGEVVWNNRYEVPADQEGEAPCDVPLARNSILLVVAVATEQLINFVDKPGSETSYSITLKDLSIRKYND